MSSLMFTHFECTYEWIFMFVSVIHFNFVVISVIYIHVFICSLWSFCKVKCIWSHTYINLYTIFPAILKKNLPFVGECSSLLCIKCEFLCTNFSSICIPIIFFLIFMIILVNFPWIFSPVRLMLYVWE